MLSRLLPSSEAAKQTPYTEAFLRQLARTGKLKAVKISRDWLITRTDLKSFWKQQATRHVQALLSLRECAEGKS
ncbi:MAG: helix-turn-helix domain-containing protein [Acidobacteriota bacterium]